MVNFNLSFLECQKNTPPTQLIPAYAFIPAYIFYILCSKIILNPPNYREFLSAHFYKIKKIIRLRKLLPPTHIYIFRILSISISKSLNALEIARNAKGSPQCTYLSAIRVIGTSPCIFSFCDFSGQGFSGMQILIF